jgi:hypothetical protein
LLFLRWKNWKPRSGPLGTVCQTREYVHRGFQFLLINAGRRETKY